MTKILKKKLGIYLIIFLVIVVVLALFTPALDSITGRTELTVREAKLLFWHNRTKLFMEEKGQKPNSLYEVSWFDGRGPSYIKVAVPQDFDYRREGELLDDPNRFFQEVEYVFASHKYGWLIMELKPGARYRHRLTVDEDGTIYQLRQIPTER